MTNIYTWSTTAGDNDDADTGVNWAEFQDPDTVNNSARTMMARVASWRDDLLPKRSSAGSTNAYTVTAAAAPSSFSSDFVVWFKADRTNSGTATLTVNSLAAKPLRAKASTALASGEIQAGTIVGAYYVSATDEYLIVNSGFHANALVPSMVTAYAVGLKAGMMTDWAGSTLPTGYLWCDGSAVSRTTYADLFSAISTTYGVGNGSTTFNVPDLRGRATFGDDHMGGSPASRITNAGSGIVGTTLGATGGDENVTLVTANVPSHAHSFSATTSPDTHTHFVSSTDNVAHGGTMTLSASNRLAATATTGSVVAYQFLGSSDAATVGLTSSDTHDHTVSGTTGSAGSGTAVNKMPPALICNKIILAIPTAAGGGDIVPEYTVVGLPTSGPNIAIATNGRKNGEGAGSGTGVLAFRVSTSWFASDTGAAVSA